MSLADVFKDLVESPTSLRPFLLAADKLTDKLDAYAKMAENHKERSMAYYLTGITLHVFACIDDENGLEKLETVATMVNEFFKDA